MEETLSKIESLLETLVNVAPTPWFFNWEFLTFIVLTLTLGFLIFYTFYTKKIYESTFMPFIYVVGNDFNLAKQPNNVSFQAYINLVNLGKGPAVDVKIHSLKVGYFHVRTNKKLVLLPNSNNPEKTERVTMNPKKLEAAVVAPSTTLKITCKDQIGKEYTFKYDISNPDHPKYIGG